MEKNDRQCRCDAEAGHEKNPVSRNSCGARQNGRDCASHEPVHRPAQSRVEPGKGENEQQGEGHRPKHAEGRKSRNELRDQIRNLGGRTEQSGVGIDGEAGGESREISRGIGDRVDVRTRATDAVAARAVDEGVREQERGPGCERAHSERERFAAAQELVREDISEDREGGLAARERQHGANESQDRRPPIAARTAASDVKVDRGESEDAGDGHMPRRRPSRQHPVGGHHGEEERGQRAFALGEQTPEEPRRS